MIGNKEKNGEVEYISINPKDGENKQEDVEFKSTQEKKNQKLIYQKLFQHQKNWLLKMKNSEKELNN